MWHCLIDFLQLFSFNLPRFGFFISEKGEKYLKLITKIDKKAVLLFSHLMVKISRHIPGRLLININSNNNVNIC